MWHTRLLNAHTRLLNAHTRLLNAHTRDTYQVLEAKINSTIFKFKFPSISKKVVSKKLLKCLTWKIFGASHSR